MSNVTASNSTTISLTPVIQTHIAMTCSFILIQFPISLALLVCWCFLRNEQPLKSKLIAPPLFHIFNGLSSLGFFAASMYLLSPTANALTHQQFSYFFVGMNVLTVLISAALYSFQAIRFFAFQLLAKIQLQVANQQKARWLLQRKASAEAPTKDFKNLDVSFKRAKFFRFLSSDALFYILAAIVVGVWTAIATVGYVLQVLVSNTALYNTMLAMFAWVLLTACFLVGLAAVDILKYRKLLFLRCQWRAFFVEKDRLLFRVELMIPYFALAPFAAREICRLLLENHPNIYARVANEVIVGVTSAIIFAVLHLSVGGGVAIAVIIHRKLYNLRTAKPTTAKVTTENKNVEMLNCLQDETGAQVFEAYIKYEYSSENLICYNQLLAFKEYPTLQRAVEIRDTFFLPGSALEVNVAQKVRKDITDAISKQLTSTAEEGKTANLAPIMVDTRFFSTVETAVLENLADTFQRFRTTNTYKNYCKGKVDREAEMKKANLL